MSTDPSNSRVYLTTSNNSYESIHSITSDSSVLAQRQERNDRLIRYRSDAAKRKIKPLLKVTPTRPIGRGPSSSIEPSPAMASLDDYDPDIHRLPDSSDEENVQEAPVDPTTNGKSKSAKRKQSSPKRPLNTRDLNTEARRSKRRKTSDEQPPPSTMPEKPSARMEDEDPFFSQISSQDQKRRKPFKKYISSQNAFSTPSSAIQAKSARSTMRSVSASPEPEIKSSKKSKILDVSSSPSASPPPKRKQKLQGVESSPKEPEPVVPAVFQTVEDSDSEHQSTSNTTSGTSKSTLSDKANDKSRRERRGSSSSLSSTDSLVEYQLDASQKAALMSDANEPSASQTQSITAAALRPNHIICPTCRRSTSLLDLPGHDPKTNPTTLSLRDQTKFCYDHRIRDAQQTWKSKHYPTINWDTLPTSPVLQTQIKDLIPVLRRKTPSHYLSNLDSAITAAKGNASEINRIFDVTNVHHGYYGPRGAKVITQAIMDDSDLQKQLSRCLRNDKSMRVAGLGRLTDCVLVPEVLCGLVQEDLVLGKREEAERQAREVLEESGELGLLLCGGDDEVDGEGEEDDLG